MLEHLGISWQLDSHLTVLTVANYDRHECDSSVQNFTEKFKWMAKPTEQ